MTKEVSLRGLFLQNPSNFKGLGPKSIVITNFDGLNDYAGHTYDIKRKYMGKLIHAFLEVLKPKKEQSSEFSEIYINQLSFREMHFNLEDIKDVDKLGLKDSKGNGVDPTGVLLSRISKCPNLEVFGLTISLDTFENLSPTRRSVIVAKLHGIQCPIHIKLKDLKYEETFDNDGNLIRYRDVAEELLELPNLAKLDLSGNDFSEWPLSKLRSFFQRLGDHVGIKELNVSNCGLDLLPLTLQVELFGHLKRMPNLQTLNIQGNDLDTLTPDECRVLFNGFQHLKTVHLLNSSWGWNANPAEVTEGFAKLACFESLEAFDLYLSASDEIDSEPRKAMLAGLAALKHLKTLRLKLDVGRCYEEDATLNLQVKDTLESVAEALPGLQSLDLSGNDFGGKLLFANRADIKKVAGICAGVGAFQNLNNLSLANNGLSCQKTLQLFMDFLNLACGKRLKNRELTLDLTGHDDLELDAAHFDKLLTWSVKMDADCSISNPNVEKVRRAMRSSMKETLEGLHAAYKGINIMRNLTQNNNCSDDRILEMATDGTWHFSPLYHVFMSEQAKDMLSKARIQPTITTWKKVCQK